MSLGFWRYLPSLKLTCPLKRDYFNRKHVFQPLIFRGYVGFREGISKSKTCLAGKLLWPRHLTWRITPVSKCLVPPMYKPWSSATLLKGTCISSQIINQTYKSWMIQVQETSVQNITDPHSEVFAHLLRSPITPKGWTFGVPPDKITRWTRPSRRRLLDDCFILETVHPVSSMISIGKVMRGML